MRPGPRRASRGLIWGLIALAVLSGGAIAFAGTHIGGGGQAAFTVEAAARCVPEHLNASDVLSGAGVAVAPLPGSFDSMPETQISLLGAPAREISVSSVTGTITGPHGGRLRAYSQGDGASFVPKEPFRSGEIVTVEGSVRRAGRRRPFSFHFGIAYPDPIAHHQPTPPPHGPEGDVLRFHSAPSLEQPAVGVYKTSAQAAPGDVFLAPYSGPGARGPMIVTAGGELVWLDQLPEGLEATNLQVQQYEGAPVLTWWQGYIPPQGFGMGEEIVANTSYEPIMHIKPGDGNLADLHDFHLEGEHTAVMSVFRTIHCDLSAFGGPADAAVTDALYQELDLRTGLVRREWDSVDHVSMSLSDSLAEKASTEWPFDYFHINSIDPRSDGTTLISSRNTSALYILNTETGQVLTRVGGKHSEVKMGQGAGTAFQHDAETLPNGEISIFDNGGAPFASESPLGEEESRGMIVDLNRGAGTDTLINELKFPRRLKAGSQGDVQLLPNGDWFVGWGQEPYFSEYNPAGELIYNAHMPNNLPNEKENEESYRAYKFEWHATPHWPPAIAASKSPSGVEVWASWNGATEVTAWRVLAGSAEDTLAPVATVPKTGFETTLNVPGGAAYVEAQALNAAGQVIGNSPVIKPKE